MILYDLELSGNCYKIRLMLAFLGLNYELKAVDFLGGEHKTGAFCAMNPFGEIPVFEEEGLTLRDSQAILIYLARKYGGEAWLPTMPDGLARVMQWLSTASNDLARGPNDARLHDLFGYDLDVDLARKKAYRTLKIFENHLRDRKWLEMGRPTIADIACFPYIALGHEGGVTLDGCPAIRSWIARIKALPNFVPMPGQA